MSNSNVQVLTLGAFNGMLGGLALSVFNTVMVHGVSKHVAHKVALDFSSAFGRLLKQDDAFTLKVKAASKDGGYKCTVGMATEMARSDDSARITRICQVAEMLTAEKFVKSRVNILTMDLEGDLVNYLTRCEQWAESQIWDKPTAAQSAEVKKEEAATA